MGVVLILHACCMSLVFSASPAAILSLLTDNMENTNGDVNSKQEFDTLELRNRTVTETLSPVEDLGQDKKEENGKEEDKEKYDTLTLRNRTVTETLSEVKDFGQKSIEIVLRSKCQIGQPNIYMQPLLKK